MTTAQIKDTEMKVDTKIKALEITTADIKITKGIYDGYSGCCSHDQIELKTLFFK